MSPACCGERCCALLAKATIGFVLGAYLLQWTFFSCRHHMVKFGDGHGAAHRAVELVADALIACGYVYIPFSAAVVVRGECGRERARREARSRGPADHRAL